MKKKIYYKTSPIDFLNNLNKKKLLILAKPFDISTLDLVNLAVEKKIKIISTFDDWNFDENKVSKKRVNFWEQIAKASNSVVVKTFTAKKVLKKNLNIESEIIEDCLEFDSEKPIIDFTLPIKLCWFGKHTNHDTLLEGIRQLSEYKKLIHINVITNQIENPHTSILEDVKKLQLKKIKVNFEKWNLSFNNEIVKSDIVIIPTIEDKLRLVKSHNRLTESLNLGRFVIANNTPYYNELKKYCYLGNLKDGLIWIFKNKKKAIKQIHEGQKYVIDRFSKEAISKKWLNLINKNLNTRIRV